MSNVLSEGDAAPDFKLIADNYDEITLSGCSGKNVVLFFYPKDETPGCTQECKDFTEFLPDFKEADTLVMGVSKDDVESHEHFKQISKLEVTLLADPEMQALELYGVWVEKNMYGKKYMGIERSTFLIDKQGKVSKIWRKVKVRGHVEEVLAEVKAL